MSVLLEAPLAGLVRQDGWPCVSILYPIDPEGAEAPRERLVVRGLVDALRRELTDRDVTDVAALVDLDPVELRKRALAVGAHGVAVFRAPGFATEVFVDGPVGPLASVGDCFHVTALVPSMAPRWTGYVLTVGADDVALFHLDGAEWTPCDVPGLPRSEDEALWYERHDRQSSAHAGGPGGDAMSIVHHGGGGVGDDRHARLERFFRKVDEAVSSLVGDQPLVIAGVGNVVGHYGPVSHVRQVVPIAVGSPAERPIAEFRQLVTAQLPAMAAGARQDALARLAELEGTGLASSDPVEIADAAAAGRVETLFVAAGCIAAGDPDATPSYSWLEPQLSDVNLVVVDACRTGARILAMGTDRAPASTNLAAIFRY